MAFLVRPRVASVKRGGWLSTAIALTGCAASPVPAPRAPPEPPATVRVVPPSAEADPLRAALSGSVPTIELGPGRYPGVTLPYPVRLVGRSRAKMTGDLTVTGSTASLAGIQIDGAIRASPGVAVELRDVEAGALELTSGRATLRNVRLGRLSARGSRVDGVGLDLGQLEVRSSTVHIDQGWLRGDLAVEDGTLSALRIEVEGRARVTGTASVAVDQTRFGGPVQVRGRRARLRIDGSTVAEGGIRVHGAELVLDRVVVHGSVSATGPRPASVWRAVRVRGHGVRLVDRGPMRMDRLHVVSTSTAVPGLVVAGATEGHITNSSITAPGTGVAVFGRAALHVKTSTIRGGRWTVFAPPSAAASVEVDRSTVLIGPTMALPGCLENTAGCSPP